VTAPLAGALVLVATPIGNLGDLSPRASSALDEADLICCEDTRRTRTLLSACGLNTAPGRLVSLHAHNEVQRISQVVGWIESGKTVAVVSDAGMPGISDPGSQLVAAAIEAGVTISVVPGPSSVLAALVMSGLPTERFCMEGFLPRKGPERRARLEALATEVRTSVIFESPNRLAATLDDLVRALPELSDLGDAAPGQPPRRVAVARELTKMYEEVWRGTVVEAATHFSSNPIRGEVVIVLEGAPLPAPVTDALIEIEVRQLVRSGMGPRQVAEVVSGQLGVSRRRVYEMAIALRQQDEA
jgi:16S rRNA (cytidine1402-2'-O)-methyltransferase